MSNIIKNNEIVLVSACLTGLATRYDGKSKCNDECRKFIGKYLWVPVCPEQLGGLATPRVAADIVGGDGFDVLDGNAKVLTREKLDVTRNFIKGAEMVLEIALAHQVKKVILKSGSPSCGVTNLTGVTAALLQRAGVDLMEF